MRKKGLKDGEPCDHKGCLSHVSHPCEGCGRIAGRGTVGMTDEWDDADNAHKSPKTCCLNKERRNRR